MLDAQTDKIKQKAGALTVGDPHDPNTHLGPLCTLAQVERIEDVLTTAQAAGAQVVMGGARADAGPHYMQPTLVLANSPATETLKVEMFGPVMTLLPFDDEEEAITLANDSAYGLGSGIFTENLARAHRVSKRIRAGITWVNTYRAISPIAPFGGFNQSGYGREAGLAAIMDYTRSKTTWINTSAEPMANPFIMR